MIHRAPTWLAITVFFATFTPSLFAVELADLDGDWTLAYLDSPVALREGYYNVETEGSRTSVDSSDFAQENEILVDVFYPDPLTTGFRSFAINGTSGVVTGDENGRILSISGNRLFYTDGTDETTLFTNTTGDVMLTSSRNEDLQDQTFCLKRPSSLTTSELEGDWTVISFINRSDIEEVFNAGRLSDTFYVAEPSNTTGDIAIANDGSFSGLFEGTIAASGTTPGDVTVTVDGEGIPFKCNASKNLMIGTPGDADEHEIVLLLRKPTSLATADMAGTWRISAMTIPTTLTEAYYNSDTMSGRNADNSDFAGASEQLVDVYHTDPFELGRFQVLVDASGSFTGSVGGSMSASGDDAVSVTVEGEIFPLFINADKTIMAGVRNYANSHELIFGVKVCANCAADFSGEVDLKPVVDDQTGRIIYSWNNGSNLILQSSSTLGGWGEVSGADGADTHAVTPTGTRFFQVSEAP